MIGGLSGLSSAIAMATRSHASAQLRLSESSNRIASGTKVSSVKDNGAAYIIDQGLKRESQTWDYRESELKRYGAFGELVSLQHEEGITLQREAYNSLKLAALTPPNSSERRRYFNEWKEFCQRAAELGTLYTEQGKIYAHLTTDTMPSGDWAFDPYDTDSFLDNMKMPDSWFLTSSMTSGSTTAAYGTNIYAMNLDFMNASQATIDAAANDMLNAAGIGIARTNRNLSEVGASLQGIERGERLSSKFQDIVDNARSNMFDADIEKESAKLKAAQVKIELANNAISLFTSHYRKKTTALLNNVMSTQAGVRQ